MEDGTVPCAIRNTIECTLCEHSIVMNKRLQKLLCGGQLVETDLNCGLSGATVPFFVPDNRIHARKSRILPGNVKNFT